MVDAGDSKSPGLISLRVQVSPALPITGDFKLRTNRVMKDNIGKKVNNKITKDHFIIEKNTMFAGKHLILDMWNPNFDNSIKTLEKLIKEAIYISRATMLHLHLHHFGKNQGISGVAVLAESHISVHTWPERNYLAFDIFMCGDTEPESAAYYFIKELRPKKKKLRIIKRGQISIDL